MRTFGEHRDDTDYIDRPGSYGGIARGAEVLLVREASGIFLPGGGIEPGESPREALEREIAEETGFRVAAASEVGRAGQYTGTNAAGRAYFKQCVFYDVEVDFESGRRSAPELPNGWVGRERARALLAEEVFRWGLRRAADH